ncbi:leucine--tRNA ligase, partial [Candidatus Cerribacteria bacterium 'Amazon FNV 2010 28 9']
MTPYNPTAIEAKWRNTWKKEGLFQNTARVQGTGGGGQEKSFNATRSPLNASQKMYILYAFAYPSGSGLHVGHVEPTTALDMLARYSRMSGKDVFFPVGWDAFGLPAENYAIKTGIHPAKTTIDAIHNFENQIQKIGISYDWETEIATCHPGYYKWTQWIFIQLFKHGLAYRDKGWVNWCPADKTVLANEQVVDGKCERCGTPVVQKELEQWKFRITAYQDELLSGLDQVDWPKSTKEQQKNWIGKSEGIEITYKVVDSDVTVTCFTTTPVNFGATFLVISPEHPLVERLTKPEQKEKVHKYIQEVHKRSDFERENLTKDKTGAFTGSYAINHVTGEPIPIWVSDFVLMHVGTGAVQGCPGHDRRDFDFAKKFGIPIKRVVVGVDGDTSPVEKPEQLVEKGMKGSMINSDFLNGLDFKEAMQKTMDYFEEKGWGKRIKTYKLRDWLISRQRYWGAPIPMVYCADCASKGKSWFTSSNCHPDENRDPGKKNVRVADELDSRLRGNDKNMDGWYPVEESTLPVLLPEIEDFKPTDDGKSPIEKAPDSWKYTTCPGCGGTAKREVDTMDTFVDSSWYFLRYVDARNENELADKEQIKKWLPADIYLIGPEHIVLHLLYARFFTKFLRDLRLLDFDEPFMKMRHQGMILGPDGKKMSKSKGNVINPDDVIEKFGADTLRVYEMFMGPLDADKAWDMGSVAGVYRFLSRVWRLVGENREDSVQGLGVREEKNEQTSKQANVSTLLRKLHQTIKKVGEDLPEMKFNTAIAALMEFTNVWSESLSQGVGLSQEELEMFIKMLAPFAPFMTEELWEKTGFRG